MAEDPGVGTLSAVIEAMRQLFNFVQDTAKSIVNTGADIARTYLYMSWRKNSMGTMHKHGRAVQAASRTVAEHQPLGSIKKETRKRTTLKNNERNENKNRARGLHARAQGSISHVRLLNRTIGERHVKPFDCEIMRKLRVVA